jgi:hypothetical protein
LKEAAGKFIAGIDADLGVKLSYDEKSVEWVEGYIERIRVNFSEELIAPLSNVIGAFPGECVIANFGGRWRESEHGWGVCFDDDNCVFPTAKVYKQLLRGAVERGDSISSFYRVIPVLFKDSIDAK